MVAVQKGKSPFYPGQPVPVELFVGRKAQIDRIMERGAQQVAHGKPVAIFVQGEYGIGKSSVAGFVQRLAEKEYRIHGIYAPLGVVQDLTDVAAGILEATLRSGVFDPRASEKILDWLSKYVGKQEMFGFSVNFEALRRDAVQLTSPSGVLRFLAEVAARLKGDGVKGVCLILDEINGITGDPQFAHFIKGLVDTNAMSAKPIPLLLVLCGVQERRREMIQKHQPVERIFDVVDIEAMSELEMGEFFQKAFSSVSIRVKPGAMETLIQYSAGFPKIMHLVGDAAYWLDQDGCIDEEDAAQAVLDAADEVGRKYVDQQVYRALRSADYRALLDKIAEMGPDVMKFKRSQVVTGLTKTEEAKLGNFLQRMKSLHVIRSGDVRGEYAFNHRMVRLYIWLNSIRKKRIVP